ncbi:membrane protein [Halogranum rubrum]|uniref:Membrane protein n=1 Tax=Halogranum rubrum TaxID=553466 RepID=A0A1I4BWV6_9EURY|nr:YihY/virulence factor BrkB family protein [Halogranum rubrum]SFK73264.1 membrane protein [Halogranum rubrum]
MSLIQTGRSVVDVVRKRDVTLMAAGVAHYALASLLPILVLSVALATYFGGEALVDTIIQRLGDVLSESGQTVLRRALSGSTGRVGASVISLLLTLWSGLKVFRGLSVAFSEVYGEHTSPSLLEQVRDGLLVMALVVVAFALMVAVGVVITYVDLPFGYPRLAGALVLLVTLVVVFIPFYYVLPPVSVDVREILPGTVFAAVGMILLQVTFLVYTQGASKYAAYGFLGAILLFVTWLYFGSILMLVGGVINAVLNRRTVV